MSEFYCVACGQRGCEHRVPWRSVRVEADGGITVLAFDGETMHEIGPIDVRLEDGLRMLALAMTFQAEQPH